MKFIQNKILFSHKGGMVSEVANRLSEIFCIESVSCQDADDLEKYSLIIFVFSNCGDEELHPILEEYLINLRVKNKKYILCELGNYFGFEMDCFGCKIVVQKLLKDLGWVELNNVSIDSFPDLDLTSFNEWVKVLDEILSKN